MGKNIIKQLLEINHFKIKLFLNKIMNKVRVHKHLLNYKQKKEFLKNIMIKLNLLNFKELLNVNTVQNIQLPFHNMKKKKRIGKIKMI